jgi:hypothetical protein
VGPAGAETTTSPSTITIISTGTRTLAVTVRRSSQIVVARATAVVLATGEASVIVVASVTVGVGPQLFRLVTAVTGATIRSIAAGLLIVIGPPPTDLVAALAVTPWQTDRQVPGNNLAGKAAISRAIAEAQARVV